MEKNIKKIRMRTLLIVLIISIFIFGSIVVLASPGGGSVITVESGAPESSLYIKSNGNIGIGTITPSAKLEVNGSIKITDGTQSAGKVLTSDANGLASWQTFSGKGDAVDRRASPVQTLSGPSPLWFNVNNLSQSITANAGDKIVGIWSLIARKNDSSGIGGLTISMRVTGPSGIDIDGAYPMSASTRDQWSVITIPSSGVYSVTVSGTYTFQMRYQTWEGASFDGPTGAITLIKL